jgi:hypothetical protein
MRVLRVKELKSGAGGEIDAGRVKVALYCQIQSAFVERLLRQYLYFCNSKASKLSTYCQIQNAFVERLEV